jgi:hypothetical protein
MNGFDIVAVGVEEEGRETAGVIRARAGGPLSLPPAERPAR